MVKIAEIQVGQVIRNEFDQITRELLKKYAKASGDTNPIHTNDTIAEKAGLKGVIAHGLFSFGFITKLFEDCRHRHNQRIVQGGQAPSRCHWSRSRKAVCAHLAPLRNIERHQYGDLKREAPIDQGNRSRTV